MRKKRLLYNTVSSLGLQVITVISGLILPKLIMLSYGSGVNGLVNSIAQFLGFITILELGVGAVVQSALYKPLATNDTNLLSAVLCSAQQYFRKIGIILLLYIIGLCIVYPLFINGVFSKGYTVTLIISMSLSYFAQYYFGIVDGLLLSADQRGYIQYIAQSITVISNTTACMFLINNGFGIQAVKACTSILYIVRPILIHFYITRNYCINRKIIFEKEPIEQKWNGIAQHIASFVLDGTDIIVLTLFSTLSNVSIYSVYHMVVYGVKLLFLSMTNGIQALLGEMWAKNEYTGLSQTFAKIEWTIHTSVVLLFGCTASLIVPFIGVYTYGITDANYRMPVFALLITVANLMHGLRIPYNLMIMAANQYKTTQNNYLIAALLNIVISVLLVRDFGLVGIAIGTLVAMLYQTLWMEWYCSKNIIVRNKTIFIRQVFVDFVIFMFAYFLSSYINLDVFSYFNWAIMAVKIFAIWAMVSLTINFIFYKGRFNEYIKQMIKKLKR